jgi:copper(I)-binding protein
LQFGMLGMAGSWIPTAKACEFFSTTLRVYHPWTSATPADADFATVSMTFDDVGRDDRLIGVETPVAADAHLFAGGEARAVDLPIPAGRETVLGPAGSHLRLVRLRHALEVGRTYPMTLVFAEGGRLRTSLSVDFARFR